MPASGRPVLSVRVAMSKRWRQARIGAGIAMVLVGCGRSGGSKGPPGDGGAPGADAPFEGTVRMGIPGIDGPAGVPTTFEVKGGRCRWNLVETDAAAGFRIYDAKARRLFTVLPKVGSVLASALPPAAAPSGGGGRVWSFTHIGPGRIAQYPCDRLEATDGSRSYELCATKGLPAIPLEYAVPNAGARLPFLQALQGEGELPLAVTTREAGDGGRLEVPSSELMTFVIERGRVDDARFVVPDYPVTEARATVPTPAPH